MPESLVITSPEHLAQLATLLQQASELARQLSKNIVRVPKDQAWYWTERWQTMEREADEAIKRRDYKAFDSVEALITDLHAQV